MVPLVAKLLTPHQPTTKTLLEDLLMWIVSGTLKDIVSVLERCWILSGSADEYRTGIERSPHVYERRPSRIPCFMKTVMPSMARELVGLLYVLKGGTSMGMRCFENASGTLKAFCRAAYSAHAI